MYVTMHMHKIIIKMNRWSRSCCLSRQIWKIAERSWNYLVFAHLNELENLANFSSSRKEGGRRKNFSIKIYELIWIINEISLFVIATHHHHHLMKIYSPPSPNSSHQHHIVITEYNNRILFSNLRSLSLSFLIIISNARVVCVENSVIKSTFCGAHTHVMSSKTLSLSLSQHKNFHFAF